MRSTRQTGYLAKVLPYRYLSIVQGMVVEFGERALRRAATLIGCASHGPRVAGQIGSRARAAQLAGADHGFGPSLDLQFVKISDVPLIGAQGEEQRWLDLVD